MWQPPRSTTRASSVTKGRAACAAWPEITITKCKLRVRLRRIFLCNLPAFPSHRGGCVVQRGNFWLPLVFLCLVACEKPAPNSTSGASDPRRPGEVRIGDASRQFLKIEPVGAMSSEGARTYFGRTAFRPKALSAVTAPFAGRVAEVLVEPGQRVRAGAPLFALESADVLQARASLEQARLKQRLTQEVLARQNEMAKRGVGGGGERLRGARKGRASESGL